MTKSFVPFIILIIPISLVVIGYIPFGVYLLPVSITGYICSVNVLKIIHNNQNSTWRDLYFYIWTLYFITAYLSPILCLHGNYWMPDYISDVPSSWIPSATTTCFILLYGSIVMSIIFRDIRIPQEHSKYDRKIYSYTKARIFLLISMLVSFIMQTYFYAKMGGLDLLLYTFISGEELDINIISGRMGIYFIFSEMFPYLFIMWFFINNRGQKIGTGKIIIFLIALIVSCFYFGAWKGSRSNIIYVLLSAILVVHYTIHSFSKKEVCLFLGILALIMIGGNIYKDRGMNDANKLYNSPIERVIIGDLGRYNILTYEIYRLNKMGDSFVYAHGQTYLSAALIYIPFGRDIIKKYDVETKDVAGAILLQSFNQYGDYYNSRIFGVIGEGMLNFGINSFWYVLIIFSLCIRYFRELIFKIKVDSDFFFFVPMMLITMLLFLGSDMDNLLFTFVKRIVAPFIIFYLFTNKTTE